MKQPKYLTRDMMASHFDLSAILPSVSTPTAQPYIGAVAPATTPNITGTQQNTSGGGGIDIGDIETLLGDALTGYALIKGQPNPSTTPGQGYPIPPTGYYYNTLGQLVPMPQTQNKTNWVILAVFAVIIIVVILLIVKSGKK